jgi:mRNA-degrading endonuclease RelE of RelBE toxin-antitoxin system
MARIPARIKSMPKAYQIILAKSIKQDLEYIPKKDHATLRTAIETQLSHEPTLQTTNRKPLTTPIQEATWELRCGKQNKYRIFYCVSSNQDADKTETIEVLGIVEVLAIGEKHQEKLFIQGREVKP